MTAAYSLLARWSGQALAASLDGLRRARALTKLPEAEVAKTPAEVVYPEGRVLLLRYPGEAKYVAPVLLVPSIINRYYILDLRPGRSLVEFLVGRGFDVFLLDWGSPGPEERGVTFDEHIEGY